MKKVYFLDTNIFLDLFRLNYVATRTLHLALTQIQSQIVLTPKIREELKRNRPAVRDKAKNIVKDIGSSLSAIEKSFEESINQNLNQYNSYDENFVKSVKDSFSETLVDLKTTRIKHHSYLENNCKDYNNYIKDVITPFYDSIYSNNYIEVDYTTSEYLKILEEGELRKKYCIPPGYMDSTKDGNIKPLGDYLWWKEVINIVNRNAYEEIVLITADTKPDWFESCNTQPRKELTSEFKELTGKSITIKSMEQFLSNHKLNGSEALLLAELGSKRVLRALLNNRLGKHIEHHLESQTDYILNYLNKNFSYQLREIEHIDIKHHTDYQIYVTDHIDLIPHTITSTLKFNVEASSSKKHTHFFEIEIMSSTKFNRVHMIGTKEFIKDLVKDFDNKLHIKYDFISSTQTKLDEDIRNEKSKLIDYDSKIYNSNFESLSIAISQLSKIIETHNYRDSFKALSDAASRSITPNFSAITKDMEFANIVNKIALPVENFSNVIGGLSAFAQVASPKYPDVNSIYSNLEPASRMLAQQMDVQKVIAGSFRSAELIPGKFSQVNSSDLSKPMPLTDCDDETEENKEGADNEWTCKKKK